MVNESEKILSAFSQMYFYKELVLDDLKFVPENDTEKEVADVLLNIGDIFLQIFNGYHFDAASFPCIAKPLS